MGGVSCECDVLQDERELSAYDIQVIDIINLVPVRAPSAEVFGTLPCPRVAFCSVADDARLAQGG